MIKNMFCKKRDLNNEASVESRFVDRLLIALKYTDGKIKLKESISQITIGKGSKKENYKPDYVLLDSNNDPIIVIDAKSTNESPEEFHYQVSSYALYLNQKYQNKNPVIYIAITNGYKLVVYPWDSEQAVFFLNFDDFSENNEKWKELKANISFDAFKQVALTKDVFVFEKPEITKLLRTFHECHNIIRKKESSSPTDAFYEFCKIMFIKIREDNNIHDIMTKEEKVSKSDFIFSTHWIDNQKKVEPNPFDAILFRHIQEELEGKIKEGKKKRIFEKEEHLNLKAETIYEVVKTLQNFDLYGIDEDLNGRMFEIFLNATVRGKDLGQFFTPRGVVHYMIETAPLDLLIKNKKEIDKNIPFVLDACCGSGGFLIDAMADMSKKIFCMNQLTNTEKDIYDKAMKNMHLYGIDANYKIARVSRLNMYLHGDGGSKIFKADALDKKLKTDPGMDYEEKAGIEELKNIIQNERLKFDVVLTNPPFSINYSSKDPAEKIILSSYDIAKTTSGAISARESSNVLFIERYKELLKDEAGELLTILDDTVLNGDNSQKYRKYILDNFIIIQIISLPFNTFFRADANIKTSIIHLRRKKEGEKQGNIFMAITNNIGHDDHQKETPDRNNLSIVVKYFNEWKKSGNLSPEILYNQHEDEPLGCPLQIFEVEAKELNPARLDAFYYSPELMKIRNNLFDLAKKDEIILKKGSDFTIIPTMKKNNIDMCLGNIYKYFEIGDVTIDGSIISFRENYFENLPTRGRLQVKKNDIIFAKNNSSRGTTVLIPEWYDGNLVTTGFIGIRPKDYEEALILWNSLESEYFRKQLYYLAITASQPEVRESIFKKEILVAIPKRKEKIEVILKNAKTVDKSRNNLIKSLTIAKKSFESLLN